MPIKYGDLTIIHTYTYTILSFFGLSPSIESKLTFLFEDDTIYGVDDKIKNINFKFEETYVCQLPRYFTSDGLSDELRDTNKKKTYFRTKPIVKDGILCVRFNPLFSPYKKYDKSIGISSVYNGTYYYHKSGSAIEVFGILGINSNQYMPRYQFAYDSEEFTKEEVIYLINRIFT